MNKVFLSTLILFFLIVGQRAYSQSVYFTGLGRANVTNETFLDSTESERGKSTGGYTLFDLGINAEPGEELRASAILRLRNEFGGFFGAGSRLEFRQLRLEGTIGNKVRYGIGDIDLNMTPYTLHNFGTIYDDYENLLFEIRRDIIEYENFYTGDNKWRLQGINAYTTLRFDKGIKSLMLRTFGTRVRPTNFANQPDRMLAGGEIDLVQSKYARIGLNYINTFDLTGTVKDSEVDYNNKVYTADARFTYETDALRFDLEGEGGISNYSMGRDAPDTTVKHDDYFYDAGIKTTYKPLGISLKASYRNVGARFYSPGAQTRRNFADVPQSAVSPQYFPEYNENAVGRQTRLFDRYSQETGIYNRSVRAGLMPYRPEYNNVEPYGPATPNRRGFSVKAAKEDTSELVNASLEYQSLSEINPMGDSANGNKRDFTSIRGGFNLNIDQFIGYSNTFKLNFGVRHEKTKRGGDAPVDLKSTLFDAGVNFGILKRLELLGGYKMLSAKGTEYIPVRGPFNDVIGSQEYTVDMTEGMWAFGFRYRFSSKSFFTAQAHLVDFKNNLNADDNPGLNPETTGPNFDLNQFFFNYTIKF